MREDIMRVEELEQLEYEPPKVEQLASLGVLVRGATGIRFDDAANCVDGSIEDDTSGAC
jgi:hypothetical protein